jgi:hypothetical protein
VLSPTAHTAHLFSRAVQGRVGSRRRTISPCISVDQRTSRPRLLHPEWCVAPGDYAEAARCNKSATMSSPGRESIGTPLARRRVSRVAQHSPQTGDGGARPDAVASTTSMRGDLVLPDETRQAVSDRVRDRARVVAVPAVGGMTYSPVSPASTPMLGTGSRSLMSRSHIVIRGRGATMGAESRECAGLVPPWCPLNQRVLRWPSGPAQQEAIA